MRSYLLAGLLATLAVLVPAGATNYLVDANRIYGAQANETAWIDDYVDLLRRSTPGLRYESHRLVKVRLAETSQADCYITGSSHHWAIGHDSIPGIARDCRELVNLAVPSGSFEDLILFASIVARRPGAKRLFIGFDPWAFKRDGQLNWREVRDRVIEARAALGLAADLYDVIGNHLADKLSGLISGRYLLANLERLRTGDRGGQQGAEAADWTRFGAQDDLMAPDGSRLWRHAQDWNGNVAGAEGVRRPLADPGVKAEWHRLLDYLSSRGIEVTLVLTPYHPKALDCGNEDGRAALLAMEKTARALAQDHGLTVLGSYVPTPFALHDADFLDAHHVRPNRLARLRVLDGEPGVPACGA